MKAEIYIISGFLGAGKTTLIQKLLKEAFMNEKVVLIENDFGETSVDAALLKAGSVEVKEINSGCICCSLSGDFVRAISEIIERFHPDNILIEPSGVGKLSDIVKSCEDARVSKLVSVAARITVADVKRCRMYLDNFGEFFEDQIQNADIILLSRTEDFPESIETARKLIHNLNSRAAIISIPWNSLKVSDMLSSIQPMQKEIKSSHNHNGCEHDHSAREIFDTITIWTRKKYSVSELEEYIYKVEHDLPGTVLRAKGIIQGVDGYLELQYVPGSLRITGSSANGNVLCFVGNGLSRKELTAIFNGG